MKKILIWAGAGLALLALLLYVLLTALEGGKASVIESGGSVAITRGGKALKVAPNLRLKSADALLTGQSSSLWFRTDKSKTVLLDENSRMILGDLGKNTRIAFESGAALIKIDKALKQNESFQVQIKNVAVGMRDVGVFSIHANASGKVTLNVYQGEAVVYGQNANELITLEQGQSIQIDVAAEMLEGEAMPIDFSMLSDLFLEHVMDYAKEAGYVKPAETAAAPPKNAETSDTESETAEGLEPESSESEVRQDTEQTPPEQEESESNTSAQTAPDYPAAPAVTFQYKWDGKAFKPYANITWADSRAASIAWRLCDSSGGELEAGGSFDASAGGVNLKNQMFDVSPPSGSNLYPMGYTIRLTPYYTPVQGGSAAPMPSVTMELPYFEVEAEQNGTQLTPVIYTNIGFYFEHSHESLTDHVENGRIRITGSLIPLEGTKTPIKINAVSK